MRIQAKLLLILAGVKVSLKRMPKLDPNKTYVITPNHTSYLDILMLYVVVPNFFIIMGKNELGSVPLFNIFFKEMNILVDRKSRISGKQAMDRAAEEINKGNSIALFPEGTIPHNNPKLKPFKNGAFKLAIEQQVEVLPITFLTNYKLLEDKAFLKSKGRPGIARIIIDDPIPTKGMTEEDLVPLRQKVFDVINNRVQDYERR